jgi:hypothetical protein
MISIVNAEITAHTVINTVDGVPVGNPQIPLSSRTLYKMYMSAATRVIVLGGAPTTNYPDILDGTLIINGNGLMLMQDFDVELIPYEDVIPGITTPASVCGVGTLGSHRLQLHAGTPPSQTQRIYTLYPIPTVALPVPPQPLVTPTLHVERGWWVCVLERAQDGINPAQSQWSLTNLMVQVYLPCDGDSPAVPLGDGTDGPVQISPLAAQAVAGATNARTEMGSRCDVQAAQIAQNTLLGEITELDPKFQERTRRLKCCGWRDPVVVAGVTTLGKKFGMCINPLFQKCCSSRYDARLSTPALSNINTGINNNGGGMGAPYNFHREQCCYGGDFPTTAYSSVGQTRTAPFPIAIRFLDQRCPCIQTREREFCPRLATAGQGNLLCCTQTRYPELIPSALNPQTALLNNGTCYDPQVEKCCNNGNIYDPGVSQCCAVTGLQSPDVPCPCNTDTQCSFNQRCCVKAFPPIPAATVAGCGIYANYPHSLNPTYTFDPSAQNCAGICIDIRFQICCNGIACVDRFETCCNATCCNRFTSDCNMGLQEGSSSPYNPNNFRIPYEVCTERESLNLPRAIIAYYFPLILLVATYVGLAFSLFFAKRQNALSPLSGYEKGMYVIALLLILFSWPMYFAPVWRYGVITIWIAFFSIVAALSGIRILVLAAAIAQFIGFIYLIDFWYGSDLLTLASVRPQSTNGVGSNGNILSVVKMWRTPLGNTPLGQQCTSWYDFFLRDNLSEDWLRFDNPNKTTFGFCAREWVATLMVLCLFNIVLLAVLFFVTVITHLKNVLVKKVIMASGEPILAGLQ